MPLEKGTSLEHEVSVQTSPYTHLADQNLSIRPHLGWDAEGEKALNAAEEEAERHRLEEEKALKTAEELQTALKQCLVSVATDPSTPRWLRKKRER